MRVVKYWNRLPREAGDAPSLDAIKVSLDRALSNTIYLKMIPLTAEEFESPFQPKLVYDLMICFRLSIREIQTS